MNAITPFQAYSKLRIITTKIEYEDGINTVSYFLILITRNNIHCTFVSLRQ